MHGQMFGLTLIEPMLAAVRVFIHEQTVLADHGLRAIA